MAEFKRNGGAKCFQSDPQVTAVDTHVGAAVKTAVLFVAFMVFFHILLWLFTPQNDPLRVSIANIVVRLVNECGINAVANCTEIILPKAHWVVAPECTAINAHILFVSFVMAYDAAIRMKAVAIVIGLPFIFLINIARLVSLAWITEKHPQYASWFHNYVWQGAFLLMIVLMWMFWIELMVNRETKSHICG